MEITRVLVVDDIPLMRMMLAKYIAMIGGARATCEFADRRFEVVEALNGLDALEALEKQEIHVVFLDLMMPEMDGLTFLERKRETASVSSIPVVVTTALSEEAWVDKALSLGADSYIRKPFTIDAVEGQLRLLVARLRARDQSVRNVRDQEEE